MLRVEEIHYTEFREKVYKIIEEYNTYDSMPNTSPRVDIEDSIDDLLLELLKKVKEK